MTPAQALAFVRRHGVVLESGTGPVPSLTAAIAGGPIRGSWWAHALRGEMFSLTRSVRDSPEVLVCRLVDGKVTFVHRRLWPALARAAPRFPRDRLARIREQHTASGAHVVAKVRFPDWLPAKVLASAAKLELAQALRALGAWHR
jgi:hypothetical protein